MALNIRNEAVNQLADKLAARIRTTKTEAVKLALENELRRLDAAVPLRERIRLLFSGADLSKTDIPQGTA